MKVQIDPRRSVADDEISQVGAEWCKSQPIGVRYSPHGRVGLA
jgi:hypothetical protein